MKTIEMILLNGPSSAGKSTVAQLLKARIGKTRECRVVALDDYMPMTVDEPIWEDDVFAVTPDLCAAIEQARSSGEFVIVDHVITSKRIFDAVQDAFGSGNCLTVQITCSPEILRMREKQRGNRAAGTAEASLNYLYPKDGYDLVLDSGRNTAEQIANEIFELLSRKTACEAF